MLKFCEVSMRRPVESVDGTGREGKGDEGHKKMKGYISRTRLRFDYGLDVG